MLMISVSVENYKRNCDVSQLWVNLCLLLSKSFVMISSYDKRASKETECYDNLNKEIKETCCQAILKRFPVILQQ